MGNVEDYLEPHLHSLAGPYLFIGSGVSRRYAGLGDWKGLLSVFADKTGKSFDYYRGAAANDYPQIAELIADDFYDIWWNSSEFEASREQWREKVSERSSPLKYEVAKYTRSKIDDLVVSAEVADEFELFKNCMIDGVITTNYDGLLEDIFPGFRAYVGQDELLFSDTQGIAEIYYIHGCERSPESLVLTSTDYADYNERNAYLAAKLATIFVEHPVIFLGYSLNDKNIQQLLESLIAGLRPENVSKLQDRLIFVEWKPGQEAQVSSTVMPISGVSLPIIRAVVPDYRELFAVLGNRRRAMPARILRLLKEQVFELVQKNDPDGRLVAVSDIDDADAANLDVVFGVGAKITLLGLVGLSRWDVIDDVLESPERDLPPDLVVGKVLAKIQPHAYVPCFKYLRAAGLWNQNGWLPGVTVNERTRSRADANAARFRGLVVASSLVTVADLESASGVEWILNNALELPALTDDHLGLREFLIRETDRRDHSWWGTQFAKAAVAYDWIRYGA